MNAMAKPSELWIVSFLIACAGPNVGSAQQPADIPILDEGGVQAATELEADVACSDSLPGTSVARLSWGEAERPGSDRRVDLSMFHDGFLKRQYTTVWQREGEEPGAAYRFDRVTGRHEVLVYGLTAGVNYYWRVLSLTTDGWVPSMTVRVEPPVCPVDIEADTVPPGP